MIQNQREPIFVKIQILYKTIKNIVHRIRHTNNNQTDRRYVIPSQKKIAVFVFVNIFFRQNLRRGSFHENSVAFHAR